MHDSSIQVTVLPSEPENLPLPHSGCCGKEEEALEGVPNSLSEESADLGLVQGSDLSLPRFPGHLL